MKWILPTLAIGALCTLVLPACGGRARLGPDSAKQYRELFRVQANSRPRTALGKLSAQDAKLIMQNHNATYGKSRKAGRGAAGATSIQPLTLQLGAGGGGGGDSGGIKLRAR